MSGTQNDVAQLKLRLEEAERNTIMAATYGKQLLDENHELHVKLEENIKEYSLKLEALEQEKHAFTLKYETKVQNERSLILELEQLREQQAGHVESLLVQASQNYQKEMKKLRKVVSSTCSDLENERVEKQQNIEHIALLEAQLREAQERIDMCNTSIHDQTTDENTAALQSQVMTLTCEKQDLETKVSLLNAQVKTTKLKLSQAVNNIESLKKEVENLECQCTSYFNTLEQNKDEITELKVEIDALKLAEADTGKKGNSLFAEVEDQRQVMEKQLIDYKSKYNIIKKQHDMKSDQITGMKLQLANLLSLSSQKVDTEYLKHLEESLSTARTQLEAVTKTSQVKRSDTIQHVQSVSEAGATEEQNMTTFFKNLYSDSQKKIEHLEDELRNVQFNKVALSDRILQLQRKLRQTEYARDASNSKIIQLQVKFEELAAKKGEIIGNDTKSIKRVTQKIPGFENASSMKTEDNVKKEERIPLKEVIVNSNTLSENGPLVKDNNQSSLKDKESNKPDSPPKVLTMDEDQENKPNVCYEEHKKKPKKSVRMTETVVVQECDGEVQEARLKSVGEKTSQPQKKKVMRKMIAPVVTVPTGEQPNECKQQ